MGLIVKPFTFSTGAVIIAAEHNSDFDTLYNAFNGNISNANIASDANIDSSKVNLSDITGTSKSITQTAHGLSVAEIIRFDGSDYVTAKADTEQNAEVIGIVSIVTDVDTFTVQIGGFIDTLSGLTAGTVYYLDSSTAGLLTATETTTVGEISKPVLIAVSTTAGYIFNFRGNIVAGAVAASKLIQVVNTQDGAFSEGTTAIPFDDTIPQNTEGQEVMTLAITPTSATNKLKIEVVVNASPEGANEEVAVALFQDTTAGALAAVAGFGDHGTDKAGTITFTHYMTSGTTSATTFKVRIGGQTSGADFNGIANTSARIFGGVMASSITISEIQV